MGVLLDGDKVSIFKFKETGVVELCLEVADFVKSGQVYDYELDTDSARFVSDEYHIMVEFDKKVDAR